MVRIAFSLDSGKQQDQSQNQSPEADLLTSVSLLADVAPLKAAEHRVRLDGDAALGHAALLHLGGRRLQRRVARAQHQVVQVRVYVLGGLVQLGAVLSLKVGGDGANEI